MTIQCKICGKEMAKQITNTHLKPHGITTIEYKQLYGPDSLTSPELKKKLSDGRRGENNSNYGKHWTDQQKQEMSLKVSGRTPWNKGVAVGRTDALMEGINRREERYKNGELIRTSAPHDSTRKEKLSKAQREYMETNPGEGKRRAKLSLETKIKNGVDLGKNMRGKKHSQDTKDKISLKSKISNKHRADESFKQRLLKISEANLTLISGEEKTLQLACNVCKNVFSLTKQCFTESKFKTTWCDVCYPRQQAARSKAEIELYEFIKQYADCTHSNRQLLKNREVDIYIPSKRLAIEFNGLYWHSEDILLQSGRSKHADHQKMLDAQSAGLRYIGIFEDEWIEKRQIVESRIKNILGVTGRKIYARKCTVKEVPSKIAAAFCRINHIQGAGRSNIRYGLYLDNELVSVMTFTNSNISRKNKSTWEINRFCNLLDCTVVGGASKLFKHFIKTVDPESVISYSDSRWSEGNLYRELGFQLAGVTPPNYWYFLPNDLHRIHRYTLRKTKDDPKQLTEREIRANQGYNVVWDCGNRKWIWKRGH